MAKITHHIPQEQYGFTEIEFEVEPTLENYQEALADYAIIKAKYPLDGELGGKVGLDDKEWRDALDGYLLEGKMESDVYERMNKKQKLFIQEIKRSIKRTNRE